MEGNSQPILLASGDSHTIDTEWLIYPPAKDSATGSGLHSKVATTALRQGRQFIERRNVKDGGLPYSAEFSLNGDVWKLSGEDCFLMSPRRYIAKVSVDGTVNVHEAGGFDRALRTLLKHLKLEKVLLDEEFDECNQVKSVLVMILDQLIEESGRMFNRDVMLLHMLLKQHGNVLNINFRQDLNNCPDISGETMSAVDNFATKAIKLIERNKFLDHLCDSSLSDEFIHDAVQQAMNRYRAGLAAICPPSLKDKLNELPDDRIMYVKMYDMELFADLTTLDKYIFEPVLPMIFSKFLARVQEIQHQYFSDPDLLSNRIFLYICRSMQEVAKQLGTHIKTDNDYSDALRWEVTVLEEESQTSYSKCVTRQLQMLAKLANHYEPGGPFRTSRFPYEFQLFQDMDAIPEPVRIWLCLLDYCMKDLVQVDPDKMQMLSSFFKSYLSFIDEESFEGETSECLGTIAQDALRSLVDRTCAKDDRTSSDLVLLKYNKITNEDNAKTLPEAVPSEEPLIAGLGRFKDALTIYGTQFRKYLVDCDVLASPPKLSKIIADVKSQIEPKLVTSWTEEFRQKELPRVLAGLSVVCGIEVDAKQALSDLQICYILSIFGDRKNHQLLQLSTQQEKDFILGITAVLLALYGHKVHIICFNSSLTRKFYSEDWNRMFTAFGIGSNISFESLEDAARKRSKEIYGKYTAYINKCFGIETNEKKPINASEDESSVLLIEDIDIILQDSARTSSFGRLVRPTIPGLMEVQRKLFCQNNPLAGTEIDRYIEQSGNPNIIELRTFLDRPQSYKILESPLTFDTVEYTNRTLFAKHLEVMKKAGSMEEYYCSNVSHAATAYKALQSKYGYLSLGHIPLPYELLMKTHPLVLGFTSAPLDQSNIFNELYGKLFHTIAEPTAVGTTPVEFDTKKDFRCVDSKDEWDWMEAILVATKAAIDRDCSVLIFFKDAQEMEQLQQTTQQLRQLEVEAINTASNREDLSEHEVLRDEISVLMISNRQFPKLQKVHVIQTFFSIDEKEEGLIRMQAGRSRISGSYELIVPNNDYPKEEEITYDWLVKKRQYQKILQW